MEYDIIVIGAGHAGCEAACAAARMDCKTLLITMDMEKIGAMSCNPAMGGIAKGQIVREIDALGGISGYITDLSSIQFRMLNQSKGPAMWSPRAQCDRTKFSIQWRKYLENQPNLHIWQDSVQAILIDTNGEANGVKTQLGLSIKAKTVILTTGTFLNGLLHVGRVNWQGGRIAELPSQNLTEQLQSLGIETDRMKTGTPARVDGRSIDFEKLEAQYGEDPNQYKFSYLPRECEPLPQKPCYIAYTNAEVHRQLERGFKDSPLYNGTINSIGPRYCPSIEDKLVNFADRDSHHLFLEPEGLDNNEYYINGFSSSLPWDIQWKALKLVPGFENIQLFRPGYAIEYDYFPPTQLNHTLESKVIPNLFFAGQVNGTTGYEEAAAQGLMAGINAALKIHNKAPLILTRNQAYIGVLIDDLVLKGVDEPYRMFTSRAEYRMLLRQDNADERLTPIAHQLNMCSKKRYQHLQNKLNQRTEILELLKQKITPAQINTYLNELHSSPIQQPCSIDDILTRPEVKLQPLCQHLNLNLSAYSNEAIEIAEIAIKYKGYIAREQLNADKLTKLESHIIPSSFDYNKVHGLSTESRTKLKKHRPTNLGQASRIPGVSPSDINILLLYFGR